jgi:RNA-dependent RNA polymerase
MSKDLLPRKWPHFMEKKHKPKEAIYVSRKILGQLYDIVERVDFRPKLKAPFDDRILNSPIEVNDDHLKQAVDLKNLYDADLRRIMAQHEIKTEFEVWSTFVLSHANMSKDYKFHEELGLISSSLRERFRHACYEKAGGKDFKSLAPLAVAMYKITSDQMTTALAKLKSTPHDDAIHLKPEQADHLPLISFPWVLQSVLGKIANQQFDTSEHISSLSLSQMAFKGPTQDRKGKQSMDSCDLTTRDIETATGVQHSGDILQLFQHEPELDPYGFLGEAFDQQSDCQKQNQEDIANVAVKGGSNHTDGNLLIDLNDGNESPALTLDRSVPTVNELFDLIDFGELPRLPTEGALPERPNVAENTSLVENENVGFSSSINGLGSSKDGEPVGEEEIMEIERGPTALEQLEKLLVGL